MARVTIIIATYNRPQFLEQTIQSILRQTVEDWKLLIIGDMCGPETADAIKQFADERIFYVNLEARCGEQSGPNSIGMSVANTPYFAFANHDDIWLPNHLERALAVLEEGETDFFCGRAAFTYYAPNKDQGLRPAFAAKSPADRSLDMVFKTSAVVFEPVSSWVMRRTLFEKVGVWHSAASVYRTPLQHWLLRAWRHDAKAYFSSDVTCIYCNAEKYKWRDAPEHGRQNIYQMTEVEGAFWNEKISELGPTALHEMIESDIAAKPDTVTYFKKPFKGTTVEWAFDILLTDEHAKLYKAFGWDAYDAGCAMQGGKKGFLMTNILKRRTGEALYPRTSWDKDIAFVRAQLEQDKRWNE